VTEDLRVAALALVWMAAFCGLGALGGWTVAATAYSPQPWVQWLGLAALLPALVVFGLGLGWLARLMRGRP